MLETITFSSSNVSDSFEITKSVYKTKKLQTDNTNTHGSLSCLFPHNNNVAEVGYS